MYIHINIHIHILYICKHLCSIIMYKFLPVEHINKNMTFFYKYMKTHMQSREILKTCKSYMWGSPTCGVKFYLWGKVLAVG